MDREGIHPINGHEFVLTNFRQPTFCSHCDEFIWGIARQGYQCKGCRCVVHKRCFDDVVTSCPKTQEHTEELTGTQLNDMRFYVDVPHRFGRHNFKTPTFCRHCGSMLYGLARQGARCLDCKVNVHNRCCKNVAHICGVNTKALAQSLHQLGMSAHELNQHISHVTCHANRQSAVYVSTL